MRTIRVVTVGRSDYGIYLPVLDRIRAEPGLRLSLIAAGMHLSPEFGLTVREIEADGFPVDDRVPIPLASDDPPGIAAATGAAVEGFGRAYARLRPDLLLVLGDRYEMAAAALAALPFRIPTAHLHGGELTRGAFDDSLRHAVTKLSHLHFTATAEYARRVIQMGEEPWRVTISGAPALDLLRATRLLSRDELESRFGLRLDRPTLLVTFHPVTLEYERTDGQIGELLAAVEAAGMPAVFTMPNADTRGRVIRERVRAYVAAHPDCRSVESLGSVGYLSLMAHVAAMVGNSSSGLIEAPSFRLPVVNVGSRQDGRVAAANVISCGDGRDDVLAAIRRAVVPGFREGLHDLVNPCDTGEASLRIVERLKSVPLDDRLIRKRFHDLDAPRAAVPSGGGPR